MTGISVSRDLTITCCLYSAATSSTLLRWFTRGYLLRQIGADDYLILAATILGTVLIPFHRDVLWALFHLQQLFQNTVAQANQLGTFPSLYRRVMRSEYIGGSVYFAEFGLIKLALLAFFLRFLPLGHTRHAVYVVATMVGLFTLATTFASVFQCYPISANWTSLQTKGRGVCPVNTTLLHEIYTIGNLITDVAILFLPLPTVYKLKTGRGRKAGLLVIFSIGVVVTMATAYRLSTSIQTRRIPGANFAGTDHLTNLMLWSEVEINLGTICANIPALAALWKALRARSKSQPQFAAPSGPPAPNRKHTRRPCSEELRVQETNGVIGGLNEAAGSPARKVVSPSRDHILTGYHDIIRSIELDVRSRKDQERIEEV